MRNKSKNIIALSLMAIMLSPMVIKVVHHHGHQAFYATNEKQIHPLHEKCAICNFEFSVFLPYKCPVFFEKPVIADHFTACQLEDIFIRFPHFSFLLRAPPEVTSII